jgi:hypothetical protein
VLPYIPLALAGSAVLTDLLGVRGAMSVQLGLGAGLVVLVVGRQFLALAGNRRLLLALRDARDQLRQQALHGALTGLAHRSLFGERLQHALDAHGRRAVPHPRPDGATARLDRPPASRASSATSTTSKRRTTRSGTEPVTSCCGGGRGAPAGGRGPRPHGGPAGW